jgi:hypothetical protein
MHLLKACNRQNWQEGNRVPEVFSSLRIVHIKKFSFGFHCPLIAASTNDLGLPKNSPKTHLGAGSIITSTALAERLSAETLTHSILFN